MAPHLVTEFRSLLNAAYGQIKSVRRSDVVAIGGLAPVSFIKNVSISPLKFAADLMCLRRVGTHFVKAGSCPSKAHFDVLAMHPYSLLATPTKHAYAYDDVLIADMGKLTTLLHAARQLHTVAAGSRFGLWVTEFSWFTNPPDKEVGDAPMVSARYTAYSMYEMWRAGASLVTWFLARDSKSRGSQLSQPRLWRRSGGFVGSAQADGERLRLPGHRSGQRRTRPRVGSGARVPSNRRDRRARQRSCLEARRHRHAPGATASFSCGSQRLGTAPIAPASPEARPASATTHGRSRPSAPTPPSRSATQHHAPVSAAPGEHVGARVQAPRAIVGSDRCADLAALGLDPRQEEPVDVVLGLPGDGAP